jgi:hypothetical protein
MAEKAHIERRGGQGAGERLVGGDEGCSQASAQGYVRGVIGGNVVGQGDLQRVRGQFGGGPVAQRQSS